jgi:hypothetical protein
LARLQLSSLVLVLLARQAHLAAALPQLWLAVLPVPQAQQRLEQQVAAQLVLAQRQVLLQPVLAQQQVRLQPVLEQGRGQGSAPVDMSSEACGPISSAC